MSPNGEPALFGEGEIAPAPERLCVEALAIWNALAAAAGWPEARFLTQSRRSAMRRAIADYGGLAGLQTHLAAASKNDFLTGKVGRDEKHRNWRPDLDWFLKPANVIKILEGKFPSSAGAVEQSNPPVDPYADDRRKLRGYRPGGRWLFAGIPRPEDPRCTLAAPVLEEWRSINRVTVVPVVQESYADRLRALVVINRKHGRYVEANRAEDELARLEGRAPVLVPAPGAESPDRPPRPAPERRDTFRAVDVEDSLKLEPMRDSQKSTGKMPDSFCIEPDYADIPEGLDYGDE